MTAFYDNVYERTKETGTGSLPLTAVTDKSYRTFQEAANTAGDDPTVAEAFWAYIRNPNAADEWEISRCHLDVNGHLVRDRVYRSTTGSLIDFSEGSKVVTTEIPAQLFPEADYVVYDGPSLEDAIGKLSDGETIRLFPGTFRTSQWLDITADDVTIRGAGRQNTIIKPEDGADVGGFRLGELGGTRANRVTIEDLGYHGNTDNQDDTVKRLHGCYIRRAEDVQIRRCYFTRTHPYHEHNSGGSAVIILRESKYVDVIDCHFDDVGDRGVGVSGERVQVLGCRFTHGYDRHVAFQVTEPNDTRLGDYVTVRNCVFGTHVNGSHVGATRDNPGAVNGHWIIENNRALPDANCNNFIILGRGLNENNYVDVLIRGNEMVQTDAGLTLGEAIDIRLNSSGGSGRDVLIVGNDIRGQWTHAAYINCDRVQFVGNQVDVLDVGVEVAGGGDGLIASNTIALDGNTGDPLRLGGGLGDWLIVGNRWHPSLSVPNWRGMNRVGNTTGGVVLSDDLDMDGEILSTGGAEIRGGDVKLRPDSNLNINIELVDKDGNRPFLVWHPDHSLNPFSTSVALVRGVIADRTGAKMIDERDRSAEFTATRLVPVDLTSKSDDPSEVRYYHHDGSGTPAAGLYRSDPGNSQYVRVEDNSVTIAY